MKDVIVFNGIHALDFHEIRAHVVRIPEVVQRLREAQQIWDRLSPLVVDLTNFVASDDKGFLSHIRLKSLTAAIVQVGLFDRYRRFSKAPDFLIGPTNADSALKVASEELSFTELVEKSPALSGLRARNLNVVQEGLPILSGIALTEYGAYEMRAGSYAKLVEAEMDFPKIVTRLATSHGVEKFINVGPGNVLLARNSLPSNLDHLQILESIDLDPMLTWFWREMRDLKSAASQ